MGQDKNWIHQLSEQKLNGKNKMTRKDKNSKFPWYIKNVVICVVVLKAVFVSCNTCDFSVAVRVWWKEPRSIRAAYSLNAGFPRGYQSPSTGYLSGFLSPLSYEGQHYKKPFDFSLTFSGLKFDSLNCNKFNKLRLDMHYSTACVYLVQVYISAFICRCK